MTYVILQACCNDASCVAVCPVDCIHPTPAEPSFMRAEMLHIDPNTCIDCGACVDECPVDAIRAEDELTEEEEDYLDLNADYFDKRPAQSVQVAREPRPWREVDLSTLRVAIVGSGPAAFYAALDLQALKVGQIEMYDRLVTPYGLARFGVAPDHQSTKAVTDVFRSLGKKPNFNLNLGVEVGRHISHHELMEHHDAVVYAVGALGDRRLGIDGEDLAGSHAATEFVAWYNGHPEYADRKFDLSGSHAVVIGNGNVALDVARILLADPDHLAKSDIAHHALEALRESNVREVTVIGRRGVAQASYTNPEMLSLLAMDGVDVVIDADEVATDSVTKAVLDDEETEPSVSAKVRYAQEAAERGSSGGRRRLNMRYLRSPRAIVGEVSVEAIELLENRLVRSDDGSVIAVATGEIETLAADVVFRSVGFQGSPVADVPFDAQRGVIPNTSGRVVDPETLEPVPGVYVTGWIKRGPTGVIGTNKKCATETVDRLLEDYVAGALATPAHPATAIRDLVRKRRPEVLGYDDWNVIDRAEREAGKAQSRPRVKFVDVDSMMALVRSR